MFKNLNMPVTSVKECDYLDQDPPLRNQNYVCLSFISPEDVIKKKEVYFFENFLKNFAQEMTEFFGHLSEKYVDEKDMISNIKERYQYLFDTSKVQEEYEYYLSQNSSNLEEEYFKQNDFQTSIRGIKVRGVFDSLREAEIRSQVLRKLDDKFNVYVAQVGCWCPWSPNPEDIAEQEFAETHLNTMVKKYKENQEKRDMFYQERKRDLQFSSVKKALEQTDAWSANRESSEAGPSTEGTSTVVVQETTQETVAADTSAPQQEAVAEAVAETVVEAVSSAHVVEGDAPSPATDVPVEVATTEDDASKDAQPQA